MALAKGAVIAAALILLVWAAAVMTTGGDTPNVFTSRRTESASDAVTAGAKTADSPSGGSVFSLPKASPDFVGLWRGELTATLREPPNWGVPSQDFGTGFILVEGRVVMKLAMWAPPGAKILRLSATGVNPKHVRVESQTAAKDNLGAPLWVQERYEIALVNRDEIDCTNIQTYYRDANFARPVATVQYRGPLRRTTEAEMKARIKDIEKKGFKKGAETETSVPK